MTAAAMASPGRAPSAGLGPEMLSHIAVAYASVLLMTNLFVAGFASRAEAFHAYEAAQGRARLTFDSALAVATVGFWGCGTLASLPALLGTRWGKIQPARQLDIRALLRAMPLVAFNFAISVPIFAAVVLSSLPESSFNLRAPPSFVVLARDVAFWLLCQEFANFYLHRWMHVNKRMYAAIHKLHHSWTAPVAYVALYCHPLEHLLVNLLPLFVGPLLCGSHITAIAGWFFTGLLATTTVHSGYWICIDHGAHDDHHAKFDVNYGILGLLDSWYGTTRLPAPASVASACLSVPRAPLTASAPWRSRRLVT